MTRLVKNRWLALLPLAAVAAACAHATPQPPVDPVDEAQVLLTELIESDGNLICAAAEVDADRLRVSRAPDPAALEAARRQYPTYRGSTPREMNLSQASAQMSQAWERAKSLDAAASSGTPGAFLRSHWARADFDAFAGLASDPSARAPRRDARNALNADWVSLQYATVWSDYFAHSEGTDRDELLDWLTSRSLENTAILRDYHEDFTQALNGPCR